MDSIRLAMVQPETYLGEGSRSRNLESAYRYVADAAAGGAQLAVFPETYPGEWKAPVTWTPDRELADMAKSNGVYVIGGFAEPLDDAGERCYNTLGLYGPDGREVGRYRRTTPRMTPWIYRGGSYWDFDWVRGEELPVFDTDLGRIGILMCSEIYATELSRAMAFQGADLTVLPAGLPGPHTTGYYTWRTLVWARAIENIMFTAVCSNIPILGGQDDEGRGKGGLALICGPEEILLDSAESGVHIADLDVVRLRELRQAEDRLKTDAENQVPWRTKPGNLRDWRRMDLLETVPGFLAHKSE